MNAPSNTAAAAAADHQLALVVRTPPPRKVRAKTGTRIYYAVIIAVFFVAPALTSAWGQWQLHKANVLRNRGVATMGRVVHSETTTSSSRRGRSTYGTTTEFEFEADGRTYRFHTNYPGSGRDYPGKTEIVYLPENPAEASSRMFLDLSGTQTYGFNLSIVGLVLFVALSPLWMLLLYPTLRRRRLLISGLPIRGTVTLAKTEGIFWGVHYEFMLEGALYVAAGRMATKYEKEIPTGASVLILYDPRKPKRSELYIPTARCYEIIPTVVSSQAAPTARPNAAAATGRNA
ncbi:MAG: DUF3592 domain-containing protein [Planctomycetia bacterium]|nr:DUF3592 domain-containing protein [Planctomycetia bacterium]